MSIFPFNNNKLESNTSSSYAYTTTIEDNEEDNEEDNGIDDTFEVTLKPNLGLTNNIFYFTGDYTIKKRCLFCCDKDGYELYVIPLDNIVKIIDLTNLGEEKYD